MVVLAGKVAIGEVLEAAIEDVREVTVEEDLEVAIAMQIANMAAVVEIAAIAQVVVSFIALLQ